MNIKEILDRFDEKFVASDGRFLTGTETVGKAKQFIQQEITKAYKQGQQDLFNQMPNTQFLITKALEEQKKEVRYYAENILRRAKEENAMGTWGWADNLLNNYLK